MGGNNHQVVSALIFAGPFTVPSPSTPLEAVVEFSALSSRSSTITETTRSFHHQPPSFFSSSNIWLAQQQSDVQGFDELVQDDFSNNKNNNKKYTRDTVVRILDANTVQLEKAGIVSLAGVQTPTTGGFPECTSTDPSKRLKKLLPAKSTVFVRKTLEETGSGGTVKKRVLLLIPTTTTSTPDASTSTTILVNAALVESGYAKPVARGRETAENVFPGFTAALSELNRQAQNQQLGMYQSCSRSGSGNNGVTQNSNNPPQTTTPTAMVDLDQQFEPMTFTTETKWGVDGGKTVRVDNRKRNAPATVPKNPGDKKGCSDFETYEQALQYYETYYPNYGDVAKLDRDQDGVPCPKLPHTTNMEKYRRKVPTNPQPQVNGPQN